MIKIKEFETYAVSIDGGRIFESVEKAEFFTETQQGQFKSNLFEFYGCDYRDKDFYDPTRKLVDLLLENN